jgi:glutamyl-tRNA synthetase
MSAEKVKESWLEWCEQYNTEYADLIKKYPERTLSALNIGRGGAKPRRDIETWKQACDFMSFYYDEKFSVTDPMPE